MEVFDVETQTPGIAEELNDSRNQYPAGGKPSFRSPSAGLFPAKKGVYDQLQELQGRIKLAKGRINEFTAAINWQRQTLPGGTYDKILEEQAQEWVNLLRKAEDEWWELNFPDPARRAQEKLAVGYQRAGGQEGRRGNPKPPPPPGPPPPLEYIDPPEVQEILSRARIALIQPPNLLPDSQLKARAGIVPNISTRGFYSKGRRGSVQARLSFPQRGGGKNYNPPREKKKETPPRDKRKRLENPEREEDGKDRLVTTSLPVESAAWKSVII